MTDDEYADVIRNASGPLRAQPTELAAKLPALAGVDAVMFDVYGTLLISASGDIGAADATVRGAALVESLGTVGLEFHGDRDAGAAELSRQIERSHAADREAGIDFPEVEIRQVWKATCDALYEQGALASAPVDVDWSRLAIEFEVRTNPVWPMPGLIECLGELRRRGTILGIISNAQFFTPLAVLATVGQSLDQLGFDPNLRYYSYEHRRAKPGTWIYRKAAGALASRGIQPSDVLYVGNDMRNDVWPAASTGFRTALFAGDRRSLRLREDDPGPAHGADVPDAVVTELLQIPAMLSSGGI